MVKYLNRFGFIYYKTLYHAAHPSFKAGLFSSFKSVSCTKRYWGFHKEEMNTLINSLVLEEEELFSLFSKNTSYEIRRSIKDSVVDINTSGSLDDFITLYNQFASSRGWNPYRKNNELSNFFQVTTCSYKSEIIIAHLYIKDSYSQRVSLKSSVSVIDEISDKSIRAIIGRANRHLHFMDMLYFKKCDYKEYDFGGYDTNNKFDPKKKGINKFKDGFGGKLVYESNYTSYPLYWLFKLKKKIFNKK